jgi:hypothetical protein
VVTTAWFTTEVVELEIVTLKSKRPPPPHPSTIIMYVWFFIKGRRKIADWMLL